MDAQRHACLLSLVKVKTEFLETQNKTENVALLRGFPGRPLAFLSIDGMSYTLQSIVTQLFGWPISVCVSVPGDLPTQPEGGRAGSIPPTHRGGT